MGQVTAEWLYPQVLTYPLGVKLGLYSEWYSQEEAPLACTPDIEDMNRIRSTLASNGKSNSLYIQELDE